MRDMFKKINAREKLIGWYHSGPKLRASDLEINELFKRYTPNPLLVIIDVQPKEVGVPTDAYFAVDEIKDVSPLVFDVWFTLADINSTGRDNNFQDLCPHPISNRGRRSRGNRCRAPSPRYQGCCCRDAVYADNFTTTVAAGPAFATAGYRPIPSESP